MWGLINKQLLCSVYLVLQKRGRRPEQQPWMPWWAMFTGGQPKPNWRNRAPCLLATGSGSSDYRSLITTCPMPTRCGWTVANGQLLWPDRVCISILLNENRDILVTQLGQMRANVKFFFYSEARGIKLGLKESSGLLKSRFLRTRKKRSIPQITSQYLIAGA